MNVAGILSDKGSEVATIPPDRPIAEAIALLDTKGIGALVVSRDGIVIDGLVSERDLVRWFASRGDETLQEPVQSIMSDAVETCALTDRADGLMARMTDMRVRHLPVLDDAGHLCGIVSIGDVVKTRVIELEVEHDQLVEYVRAGQ
jgi:CBS domain-containing protein